MLKRIILALLLATGAAQADTAHTYSFGIYPGGSACDGRTGLTAFQKWSGKPVIGRVLDFISGNSWSAIDNVAWWTACHSGRNEDVIYSVPLLPADGVSTLAKGADGDYDKYFTVLAENLVKGGQGNVVIRLGWEFNYSGMVWSAAKDPSSFIVFWRRAVTMMRAVPGANFEFDWCAAAGWDPHVATTYYPGDAYVDIVGLDVYNEWWNTADKDPAHRWNSLLWTTYGLNWQKAFAAAHHKLMSWPEWGTGTRPDGHGGGDDPLFITNMLKWMDLAHNPDAAYADYWDFAASDYNAKLSDNHQPLSGVAFLTYWNWDAKALAAARAIK